MKEKAELRRDGILEDSQEYRDRIIKHWIKYWIYNKKIQEREVRLNEMRIAFDKFRQYLVNQNKSYGPTDFNE